MMRSVDNCVEYSMKYDLTIRLEVVIFQWNDTRNRIKTSLQKRKRETEWSGVEWSGVVWIVHPASASTRIVNSVACASAFHVCSAKNALGRSGFSKWLLVDKLNFTKDGDYDQYRWKFMNTDEGNPETTNDS
jgi:hypothetical protein